MKEQTRKELLEIFRKILEATFKMRTYQKTYFETRDRTFLIAAKNQERVVDKLIEEGFTLSNFISKEEGL